MKGRWTLIALIVSMAINLFLVGAGATLIIRHFHGSQGRPSSRTALRAAAMGLAPQDRGALVALLRAEGRSVKAANREARALRADAWASLSAAAFDPAATKAKLSRASALNQASRGKVEDAVIDFAATLPGAERANLGEALRRGIRSNGPTAVAARPSAKP